MFLRQQTMKTMLTIVFPNFLIFWIYNFVRTYLKPQTFTRIPGPHGDRFFKLVVQVTNIRTANRRISAVVTVSSQCKKKNSNFFHYPSLSRRAADKEVWGFWVRDYRASASFCQRLAIKTSRSNEENVQLRNLDRRVSFLVRRETLGTTMCRPGVNRAW